MFWIQNKERKIFLKVKEKNSEQFKKILGILEKFPGKSPVYIFIEKENRVVKAPKNLFIEGNKVLFKELRDLLGKESVK